MQVDNINLLSSMCLEVLFLAVEWLVHVVEPKGIEPSTS